MVALWTPFRKFTAIALGSSAGLAAYFYKTLNDKETRIYNSWTNVNQPINECALWDTNWDFLEPKSLVKPLKSETPQEQNRYNTDLDKVLPRATRHIILIRHGEYLDIGDNDETHKLTERGRLQAKFTGQRLHQLGIKWDEVIMSTMARAQETGEIILKEIKVDPQKIKNCSFIREGAPVPPQPPVGHWKPAKSQFFRDGARIEAGFRRYFHRAYPGDKDDTYTLIVGHGNVMRYFICRALQFPPEAWLRISLNHASITWLSINPSGNVSIKYMGDSGFMPPEYLTNRIPRKANDVV